MQFNLMYFNFYNNKYNNNIFLVYLKYIKRNIIDLRSYLVELGQRTRPNDESS